MKHSATSALIIFVFLSRIIVQTQVTQTGTVERVWEDGFRLHTGDQTLWVNASDLCGEKLPDNIAVGDRVSVTGEFGRIEFDASSITDSTPSR